MYVNNDSDGKLFNGLTMETLKQLGDCLGKGAFGSVYRALNWNTGETVAVKQIKLADLPKSELRVIMVWSSHHLETRKRPLTLDAAA